jgi:hypothetical protein
MKAEDTDQASKKYVFLAKLRKDRRPESKIKV